MILAAVAGSGIQPKGAEQMELSGGNAGEVPFPHHRHQRVVNECTTCHDLFPQEPGAIERLKAEGKLQKKQVMNKHCIKCHREMENAGKKSGPLRCKQCHNS